MAMYPRSGAGEENEEHTGAEGCDPVAQVGGASRLLHHLHAMKLFLLTSVLQNGSVSEKVMMSTSSCTPRLPYTKFCLSHEF